MIIFIVILVLVVDALLAIIPANISRDKGSDHYGLWWLCGFLMFPVALAAALAIPYKNTLQTPAVINAANELKEIKELLEEMKNKSFVEKSSAGTPQQNTSVVTVVDKVSAAEGTSSSIPEPEKEIPAEEVDAISEKSNLEKRQANLNSEIAKQDQIILRARKEKRADVPSHIESQKLWEKINALEWRKDKLGAFAGSEKKKIDDEISAIKARRSALNDKAEEEQKKRDAEADRKIASAEATKANLQKELNEVIKRIYEIDKAHEEEQEE